MTQSPPSEVAVCSVASPSSQTHSGIGNEWAEAVLDTDRTSCFGNRIKTYGATVRGAVYEARTKALQAVEENLIPAKDTLLIPSYASRGRVMLSAAFKSVTPLS